MRKLNDKSSIPASIKESAFWVALFVFLILMLLAVDGDCAEYRDESIGEAVCNEDESECTVVASTTGEYNGTYYRVIITLACSTNSEGFVCDEKYEHWLGMSLDELVLVGITHEKITVEMLFEMFKRYIKSMAEGI